MYFSFRFALKKTDYNAVLSTRLSVAYLTVNAAVYSNCFSADCDIRPEWPKCNLCRLRNFSSEPSELMILKD